MTSRCAQLWSASSQAADVSQLPRMTGFGLKRQLKAPVRSRTPAAERSLSEASHKTSRRSTGRAIVGLIAELPRDTQHGHSVDATLSTGLMYSLAGPPYY